MEGVGLGNGDLTGWDFRLPQYDEEDGNYEFDFGDRLLPRRLRTPGSIHRTDALVKLLNRAKLQAVCFDHKEVTILHILSAATLTFEAFDILANLKVDRVAVRAACIQRMSELEAKLPAPHPGSIQFDAAVQAILRAAERSARSPLELEKEVLGICDFLEEVVFHCKQDPCLEPLLTARLAPTLAEQARNNTEQLKVAIDDLKDMIERPNSIATLIWQDATPLPRKSLMDRLQSQSGQLEFQSSQLQRQADLLQEQSCELQGQSIQLIDQSTRLQRIEGRLDRKSTRLNSSH